MTVRLLELIAESAADVRAIVVTGPRDLTDFLADSPVQIHRDRPAHRHEVMVTTTDGSPSSLEMLATHVESCAPEALVIVLIGNAADSTSADVLAEAIAGSGVALVRACATPYPDLPLAVAVRRTTGMDPAATEDIATALGAARVSPEGGDSAVTAPTMDPEARARLDRIRAETARMRLQLREATERADRAERALARVEASTSMRVGRRLVDAAKNPRSSLTLPRDFWRMWRLRAQRRNGTAPKAAVSGSTSTSLRDDTNAVTGSQLLNPRVGMAAPLAQLSIVAVTSDDTAAALSAYAAVTRVRPHDASQIMAMIDADLVLIDTDAAVAPSAWSHLGDPSATDRERSLIDLIDVAHTQGRPVVLVRSGDPSKSAALHALAERCDLVLTSTQGIEAPSWNAGIDLASAWLPAGERSGAVYLGQLDSRWSGASRESLLAALRATDDRRIHDWAMSASMYASPWPDDLRGALGLPTTLATVSEVLDGRAVGIVAPSRTARDLLAPATAAMLAGALRVVSPADPNLDGFEHAVTAVGPGGSSAHAVRAALETGAVDSASHRQILRRLFLAYATPVMLQRLVDHLGLASRPLCSRDVAVVTTVPSDMSASTLTGSLLKQRIRPAELILLSDHAHGGFEELRAAGVSVHHLGEHASAEQIGAGVDSPYALSVDASEIVDWPDTYLLDATIDFEVGSEEVDA